MSQTSNPTTFSGTNPVPQTPIVFFGNERLATGVSTSAPTLSLLLERGFNVACVVSHDTPGASRKQRTLEVADIAAAHQIPVYLPHKPGEIMDELAALQPAVGVLVAYGRIVPQSLIDLFPYGIVNIHPSRLPEHRGPIPLESAILNGERSTSVSLMQLAKEMDAGPVYAQSDVPLTGTETKQSLADHLNEIGAHMLVELLPGILDGIVAAKPQEDTQATYDKLLTKEDGLLDWQKPAEQLEREIRAYAGWPGSRTTLAGRDVTITAAHVEDGKGEPGTVYRDGKNLGLYTTSGILIIDRLKPAGKADMAAAAFLAGYGSQL